MKMPFKPWKMPLLLPDNDEDERKTQGNTTKKSLEINNIVQS